jgi:primary-amine oxidase
MTAQLTRPADDLTPAAAPHPLDPLSASEIERAASVVSAGKPLGPRESFVTITLDEPAKPASLVFDPTNPPERRAFVVVYDKDAKLVSEVVVSLDREAVVSVTPVPDRFPMFLIDDYAAIEALVLADPRWQEALLRRGITDFSLAMIDIWPSGYTGPDDDPRTSPFLCRPLTFLRSAPGEHGYARPLEGLVVTVDMDSMTVVEVADHGIVAIPAKGGNYEEPWMFSPDNRPAFTGPRTDVKPISITQPDGPSFTVDGWGVEWQKWSLRIGFNAREGLVLHQISYDDRGSVRPVVYRASLSEMVVPYGDSTPTHWNKNVFDMGEIGMGFSANSLVLGCDCLGHIHYFDGVVHSSTGAAVTIPNAICMHEEDVGISWKHTDYRTGSVQVRRSRRLVISTVATVGNYEYGFYWYLYTDGSIELDVKLTGVLTTGAIAIGERPRWGELVAPGLYGPNHQHFFNIRLDMAVDGPHNSVYEVDSIPDPEPEFNPYDNAWIVRSTLIESESAGGRSWDHASARSWKVVNPGRLNELGSPVGYRIEQTTPVPPLFGPKSPIYTRGAFLRRDLWVTAYDPAELYGGGAYPYQSPDAQGLPVYVADDAPLVDTDVVVWVTVGAHHVVRPEDWPVMPVVHAGLHLKPAGFFDGNPALDMPPTESAHCC